MDTASLRRYFRENEGFLNSTSTGSIWEVAMVFSSKSTRESPPVQSCEIRSWHSLFSSFIAKEIPIKVSKCGYTFPPTKGIAIIMEAGVPSNASSSWNSVVEGVALRVPGIRSCEHVSLRRYLSPFSVCNYPAKRCVPCQLTIVTPWSLYWSRPRSSFCLKQDNNLYDFKRKKLIRKVKEHIVWTKWTILKAITQIYRKSNCF